MRLLDEIASDYDRAEITAVWFQDRATSRNYLLYAVAEMCPGEQELSKVIETPKGDSVLPFARASLSEGRTLYIARVFLPEPNAALLFYRGAGGRRLPIQSHPTPEKRQPGASPLVLESIGALVEEPPGEHPLVVKSGSPMLDGLPSRGTALRLLSLLDVRGETRSSLSSAELDRVGAFATAHLGIDLAEYGEHLGAVHLCFSNPILRSFDERLTPDNRDLVFESRAREGRTVQGCTLELIDQRDAGNGFHIRHSLQERTEFVPIPNRPHNLRTMLFAPSGECLADELSTFIQRFDMKMDLMSSARRVQVPGPDGSMKEHIVHTYTAHESPPSDAQSNSPAEMIERERRRRLMQDLRKDDTFYYFSGGDASYEEARSVVRKLLGKARDRCLLCDVFVSARDVAEFLPFVRRIGLPIRVLGSAWFLRRTINGSSLTYGEELKVLLDDLQKREPGLKITCRVLSGRNGAPVHDRFLMLDNDVFLLGSSLNELGRRATTLFRVPDPDYLRAELEKWWDARSNQSRPLNEWLLDKHELDGWPS